MRVVRATQGPLKTMLPIYEGIFDSLKLDLHKPAVNNNGSNGFQFSQWPVSPKGVYSVINNTKFPEIIPGMADNLMIIIKNGTHWSNRCRYCLSLLFSVFLFLLRIVPLCFVLMNFVRYLHETHLHVSLFSQVTIFSGKILYFIPSLHVCVQKKNTLYGHF